MTSATPANGSFFECEQIVRTDKAGRIARIEHVDLPGQLEALSKFKALLGSG